MPLPFSFSPMLRFTPPAGLPIVKDLSIAAITVPVIAKVSPELVQEVKEIINRDMDSIRYGWRLHVSMQFFVLPGSADDLTLTDVLARLGDEDQLVELSMDAGAHYRPVVLEQSPIRTNVQDKNIGAIYDFPFVTKILRDVSGALIGPPPMDGWV